jgi:hypothetical protein
MAKKLKVTLAGVDFALTRTAARGSNLPKRFDSEVELVVNGEPAKLRVTDNVAFAGARKDALQYIWIYVEGEGAYYATLGYGKLASEYAGEAFDVVEGTGPKPPERAIAKENVDRARSEFDRMTKFSATWAKR